MSTRTLIRKTCSTSLSMRLAIGLACPRWRVRQAQLPGAARNSRTSQLSATFSIGARSRVTLSKATPRSDRGQAQSNSYSTDSGPRSGHWGGYRTPVRSAGFTYLTTANEHLSDAPGLIQVAGIVDAGEAAVVAESGVDWLGFPLRLAHNTPDLSEADAAEVIAGIQPPHRAVVITYERTAGDVLALCRQVGARIVQLHGDVHPTELRELKRRAAGLTVIKSLVVRPDNERRLHKSVADTQDYADLYITDTFDPATGAEGATGLTHDWHVSADLVRRSPRPIILAGGLRPDNVAAAIEQVRPAGVDAHTGLEGPDGRKDLKKVRRFVAAAREAFARLH